MMEAFKVAEVEAYYARARAPEDAGKGSTFSPQKKAGIEETLDLYKKVLIPWKEKAGADIVKLEKAMK